MLKNTGIIIQDKIAEEDFIAGGVSGIEYKEINPSGNWTDFLPHEEVQKNRYMDSMSCVSYSLLNCLEAQLLFFIEKNLLPKTHLDFLKDNGYMFNGQPNFADRYLSKMSGTTHLGNYLTKVAGSARNDGILPEKDWGFGGEFRWNDYYKEIPEELKKKAKKFYDFFEVKYEWVSIKSSASREELEKQLKHAPLQIAVPICNWNNAIITPCGKTKAVHAVMLTNIRSEVLDIFDHYVRYEKKLSMDYPVPYAMKIILKIKSINNENMKLYIDGNNNQVLGDEKLKFGYTIPDPKKLEEITTHCAKMGIELEKPIKDDMIGWYIVSGTTAFGWKNFLNL